MKTHNLLAARSDGSTPLLEQRFRDHLGVKGFWTKQDVLLLACSGGLDSVVLAHLLYHAGQRFALVHCNFNLRGEESKRDEAFVRQLAVAMGVPVYVQSFDTAAILQQRGGGVQEMARELRYTWFVQLAAAKSSMGNAWVLTAHQADDLAETMAMNFFRGTGLAGLHGIQEHVGIYVRPLLFATRKEILDYAEATGIDWVEDSSNATPDYTRNRFRQQILPGVEEVFPAVRKNLVANAKRFAEIEIVYRKQINAFKNKLIEKRGGQIGIAVNSLKEADPLDTIVYEIFSDFGFGAAQVSEIKKLFTASSGKWIASATHRVLRDRAWLLVEPVDANEQTVHVVDAPISRVTVNGNELLFNPLPNNAIPDTDPHHAWIDAADLHFPLLVRPWKQGDYFYPLGMKRKKKISRFLTDLKLSAYDKEQQYVVESAKRIVWVVGKRIDNRFRVSDATQHIILIQLRKQS